MVAAALGVVGAAAAFYALRPGDSRPPAIAADAPDQVGHDAVVPGVVDAAIDAAVDAAPAAPADASPDANRRGHAGSPPDAASTVDAPVIPDAPSGFHTDFQRGSAAPP